MKAIRHAKIKTIIENTVVETQEDLAEALRLQRRVLVFGKSFLNAGFLRRSA